jgi:predicted enzyme related to lactoylglutathione lyase
MKKFKFKKILALSLLITSLFTTSVFATDSLRKPTDIKDYAQMAVGQDISSLIKVTDEYKANNKNATIDDLNRIISAEIKKNYNSKENIPNVETLDYSSYLPIDSSQLNSQEKALFNSNPYYGAQCLLAAQQAVGATQRLFSSSYGYHNDNADAFRHSYWNGGMTIFTTQNFAAQFANAANYKIFGWESLPWGNVDQIKAALYNLNPVVLAIPVYPDFDNLSPSNDTYNDYSGSSRGNHAVCVVGYDDSKQAVKIINSWDTDWGLDGYGWISYDLIDNLDLSAYTFPVSPWNFGITNRSGTLCQFMWSAVDGNNYAIYRKVTGSTGEPTKVQDVGATNEVDLTTPFGSYDYCVAIVDSSGNRISNFSTSTTIETFLGAPTNFIANGNRVGMNIQFEWDGTPGENYGIYRRVTGTTDTLEKVKETTSTIDTAVTLSGSCDFYVAKLDSAGNRISHFSNVVTVVY